ncbi:hypothetical protein COCCADRAFT_30319 [Bipolaris zeicola 26-R-13]|uniref:DUF3669 domain-containing protein n=1 Tax=Cochliobolus carbonum (strain 26-R-13) TaxID=930089 RepID=W6Y0B1_COCC2|nr:uncharacterized protein COCCADRAFT_30319 [Bipolaris zeicola 26-R-13]EUC28429.1 hypothetical protein COCCADRAFT_30319 [Bipolaris zeicola 26-R-13]
MVINESNSSEESIHEILRRTLSPQIAVSSSCGFANPIEKLEASNQSVFAVIGRGTCGTVFEVAGSKIAIKKGSDKYGLWVDANITHEASRAVMEMKVYLESIFPGSSIPLVPQVHGWVHDEELEKWWYINRSQFPDDDNEIGFLFYVERILPLPEATRTALIRKYFPREFQDISLRDPSNRTCLIRPYLGMRRTDHELKHPAETLQNFPLHLDQMEEIGLDIAQFSREMAIGLAIIHWRVGSMINPFSVPVRNMARRPTHLWMLDFDKTSKLDFNDWKKARGRMVTAVTGNDPYFPNPATSGEKEKLVWSNFEEVYLQAARAVLKMHPTLSEKARTRKYPEAFLIDWKKRAQSLEETKDGSFMKFVG